MAINHLRAIANCDEVMIVWLADKSIPQCPGFALEREVDGKKATTFVPTWVGFKGHPPKQKHESQPSTVWPVQRYIWSDLLVQTGQKLRYRVVPMVGKAGNLNKAAPNEWSGWSNWVTIGTGTSKGFEAYFNRGIVPAQWLAAQHPSKKSLQDDLDKKGSKNRDFLSGALRVALLDLLAKAKRDGTEIYAALYELNDPELIDALKAIGGKCNLVLGSGAYHGANKKKNIPAMPDENAEVRKDLKRNSSINVSDRLVKSPHFAHNKFVVFCDKKDAPETLWTGSTNWTMTGLCTQVNNGILIRNSELAAAYRKRWEDLKNDGAQYPVELAEAGSKPARASLNGSRVTAWNVPCLKLVDLADAERRIKAAQDGVLFLMFNPGPKNTLLNAILKLNSNKLFIHGIVNQDPGGSKAPLIKLTHKGKQLPQMSFDAILPAALQKDSAWFDKEFTFNRVMIHSKVVVIDPFGKAPVVMTGSHNLGPKASGKNDDNLVIVEKAPGLAAEYAVNIMAVYGHYKWLYNLALQNAKGGKAAKHAKPAKKATPQYDGNEDDDQWQSRYLQPGANLREIKFWLGMK